MKNLFITAIVVASLCASSSVAFADEVTKTECQPTYGGGQNCKTVTTRGGNVVYPAVKSAKTPSTGAEMLSLLSLIPAALTGFALRNKAK